MNNIKVFKYKDCLCLYENCPPVNCKGIDTNAFRWIFEDGNERNFKPVLLISPQRINNSKFDNNNMKCSGYALSLYDSFINAKNSFFKLYRRNKNIINSVGNRVAEIVVYPNDGLATEPSKKENNKGHFDFFEYIVADFHKRIVKVENLIA